jgi:hypothetical protein
MNRRGFFGLLAGAAAGAAAIAVSPDLAELLTPRRTIFLPPVGGWMGRGNQLLTQKMITEEALRVLSMTLEFEALTKAFDPAFLPKATVASSVITIHRPLRYASKEIFV